MEWPSAHEDEMCGEDADTLLCLHGLSSASITTVVPPLRPLFAVDVNKT